MQALRWTMLASPGADSGPCRSTAAADWLTTTPLPAGPERATPPLSCAGVAGLPRRWPEPRHAVLRQRPLRQRRRQRAGAGLAGGRRPAAGGRLPAGSASNQICSTYPYLDNLAPSTRQLLQGLKQQLDPEWRISLGVLGL